MEKQEQFNYTLTLKLKKSRIFFGPGVLELLQRISQTNSLNTAAKQMKMSYNKAWCIIKKAEEELGYSLVHRSVGGANGGGSTVTTEGKLLMDKFLRFQEKTYEIANKHFNEIFSDELEQLEEEI